MTKTIRKVLTTAFTLPLALACTTSLFAGEQTLNCTLYMATSMDSAAAHQVSVESAKADLTAVRRASYCVFADGKIADKQFVVINRSEDGGSVGSAKGFSIYTMDNGDSLSTEFTGGWNKGPFEGIYTILGGTGAFADAKGDGTITGSKSPWATSGVLEIVLNVITP